MRAKHWIKIWLSTISLALLVGLVNYTVDPNGFNRMIEIPGFNKIKAPKSDSMPIQYKMPRLREGGWDNLMMGTSSIGVMDNNVISKYLDGRTFNLSQPASAMPVQFDSFMYAVHYNNIKNVVYAVDFISFNKNRKLNADYIQLKDKLRSLDGFYTYNIYFNKDTLVKSLKLVWQNYKGKITPSARYMPNGQRVYQNYLYEHDRGEFDVQKKMDGVSHFLLNENGYYENYTYSPMYMDEFKKIVRYCKDNNINLYVYISPLYKDFLVHLARAGLLDEFMHFKQELANVTDYIDFTGNNALMSNINNFWDPLHLRVENTSIVMGDVFNEQRKDLRFATYMSKTNIQENLKKQSFEYKDYNLSATVK